MSIWLQKLKSFKKALSFLHPITCGSVWNANLCTPMLYAHRFDTNSIKLCVSSVQDLIPSRRPLAVVFAIPSVVVYSVQRHPLRAITHVGMEVFKLCHPPVANFYTPSTVIRELWIIRVVATIFHILPNPINRGSCHPMFSLHFNGKTATRRNKPITQVLPATSCFLSALADAVPHDLSSFVNGPFYNGEPTKLVASNIYNHNFAMLRL